MTTSTKSAPNLAFLLQHPYHFVALGFGTGLMKWAPGTFGTLVGLPLFWLLSATPESIHYLTLAGLFLRAFQFARKQATLSAYLITAASSGMKS